MFSTVDSQPQEWLSNRADAFHTLAFCCFRDGAHARRWVHRLVPRNQNGELLKWSTGGTRQRVARRREEFVELFTECFDEIDFAIHCISSTEGQIGNFANYFYLDNLKLITQQLDKKGRNCLAFQITEKDKIVVPVLRAAKLLWIYFCVKYMKEAHGLRGFIYSDWFSCDVPGADPNTYGISLVNFLLSSTGVGLQLSISKDPKKSEPDLLSDWLSGWCNTARAGGPAHPWARRIDTLSEQTPGKFDAIHFDCRVTVKIQREDHDG